MEKLYVFAGKAKTGKDSAADITQAYYEGRNKKVIRYSCTVYLKDYVKKIYGWDGNEETKPREELQVLGRKIKEEYPNLFIERMREDIKYLSNYCDIMIITGVRLLSELELLKSEFNGILIKVINPNLDNGLTEKQKNDVTETEVDKFGKFDFVINNDSNIDNLKEKTNKILRSVENEY